MAERLIKNTVWLLCLLFFCSGSGWAISRRPAIQMVPANYSMVGIRLGAWINEGETPITEGVKRSSADANFYTELFYDYRFCPILMLETSMGIASYGDVTIVNGDDKYIGTVNVYSFLVQMKLSPLSKRFAKIHPFLIGGGGFAYGRQNTDIILASGATYDPYFVGESSTDFMTSVGGGVDIPLSTQLGLNVTSKYHWINFDDKLFGASDYSGLTVSVGVAYFLHKK